VLSTSTAFDTSWQLYSLALGGDASPGSFNGPSALALDAADL